MLMIRAICLAAKDTNALVSVSVISGIRPSGNTDRSDTRVIRDTNSNNNSKQPSGGAVRELPRVSEYMDERVPTLDPNTPILTAIDFLLEQRVTCAPVVFNDKVVGMVTEKDCLKVLSKGGCDCAVAEGTVGDYMSTIVVCVSPDTDVFHASGLFLNNTFRRLLVTEDEKLVGAITRFDILRGIQSGLRS
jgi:CBS domain-containing protein